MQRWRGVAPRFFRNPERHLEAALSRDELAPGDLRWHISVRHLTRVPEWDEVALAGHELRPGVVFCIGVPPRSWWLNLHQHVLHLYELKDEQLIRQWQFERLGMEPTKGGG